jgi:hypothetical protein
VTLLLAFKGMASGTEYLTTAIAILILSTAARLYAARFQDETWAFTAGLGLNLAATLVLFHWHADEPFAGWWVQMVQVNVLVAAGYALISGKSPSANAAQTTTLRVSQSMLGLAAMLLVFVVPVTVLHDPQNGVSANIVSIGSWLGWCAFLAALIPAARVAAQLGYQVRSHLTAIAGLGIGALTACCYANVEVANWGPYHVLLAIWIVTVLAVCLAGIASFFAGGAGEDSSSVQRRWIFALCLLIQVLACCGSGNDPSGPMWTGTATLFVFGTVAVYALRTRQIVHIFSSGVAAGLLYHVIALARFTTWR